MVIYYSKSWRIFSSIYKTFGKLKESLFHAGAQKNRLYNFREFHKLSQKTFTEALQSHIQKRINRDYGVLTLLILVPLIALQTVPKAIIPINWLRT